MIFFFFLNIQGIICAVVEKSGHHNFQRAVTSSDVLFSPFNSPKSIQYTVVWNIQKAANSHIGEACVMFLL